VGGLAVLDVLGPVHHPWRDELEWAGDDGDDLLDLVRAKLASADHTHRIQLEPCNRLWSVSTSWHCAWLAGKRGRSDAGEQQCEGV